jgi:putative acetyltransferase
VQPKPFTIRAEQPDDVDAIAAVVTAAFSSPAEARLVALIRASEHYVAEWSLVAVADGEIVGHVMISYVTLRASASDRRIASLSPLAVAPARQRAGIGSALVREATARADSYREPVVVLEGSPDYYGRLGFEPAAPLGIDIDLPSWAPPEAAQVLRLDAYDASVRGRVVYPPAFDEVTEH